MSARMNWFSVVGVGLVFGLIGCESTDSVQSGSDGPVSQVSDEYEGVMDSGPQEILPETHMAAGRLHESQNNLPRAAQQYRMAIGLRPNHVEAYNRLGIVLDQLGRFRDADIAFMRAIELAPSQAHLHNNLGFSYTMQRRWGEAEAAFRRALELNPEFVRARVNLGMALAQQDRFDEAYHEFAHGLKKADSWYNMGLMYTSRRKPAEAAGCYKKALELQPNMVAARHRLDALPRDVVEAADPSQMRFAPPSAIAAASTEPVLDLPAVEPVSEPVEITQATEAPAPVIEPEPVVEQVIIEAPQAVAEMEVVTATPDEAEGAPQPVIEEAAVVVEASSLDSGVVMGEDDYVVGPETAAKATPESTPQIANVIETGRQNETNLTSEYAPIDEDFVVLSKEPSDETESVEVVEQPEVMTQQLTTDKPFMVNEPEDPHLGMEDLAQAAKSSDTVESERKSNGFEIADAAFDHEAWINAERIAELVAKNGVLSSPADFVGDTECPEPGTLNYERMVLIELDESELLTDVAGYLPNEAPMDAENESASVELVEAVETAVFVPPSYSPCYEIHKMNALPTEFGGPAPRILEPIDPLAIEPVSPEDLQVLREQAGRMQTAAVELVSPLTRLLSSSKEAGFEIAASPAADTHESEAAQATAAR